MKTAYAISRTRDEKGNIIKRSIKDYVNTIHTLVGGVTKRCRF